MVCGRARSHIVLHNQTTRTDRLTSAEVAEELMKRDDADVALHGLINFRKRKKVENDKKEEEGADDTEIQQAKSPKNGRKQ